MRLVALYLFTIGGYYDITMVYSLTVPLRAALPDSNSVASGRHNTAQARLQTTAAHCDCADPPNTPADLGSPAGRTAEKWTKMIGIVV